MGSCSWGRRPNEVEGRYLERTSPWSHGERKRKGKKMEGKKEDEEGGDGGRVDALTPRRPSIAAPTAPTRAVVRPHTGGFVFFSMEGGGFDFFSEDPSVWPSQPSVTGLGHAPPHAGVDALDLNSQVPAGEDFPHLHDYGSYLQGDGEDGARRGRGKNAFC
ncbi:hypothetical protein [Oryza sativa Japonica Group]|uniref:Uncharacterized protein n=2 Tax=Oryza sativa subsp. japonica TaxID=39947 RepID=Q5JLB9_ORYSJ|nr:hypothetical protein [Oryza sativa Japonica Group]